MWAFLTVLLVLMVVAALYFGGFLTKKKEIDINIKAPGVILPVSL